MTIFLRDECTRHSKYSQERYKNEDLSFSEASLKEKFVCSLLFYPICTIIAIALRKISSQYVKEFPSKFESSPPRRLYSRYPYRQISPTRSRSRLQILRARSTNVCTSLRRLLGPPTIQSQIASAMRFDIFSIFSLSLFRRETIRLNEQVDVKRR